MLAGFRRLSIGIMWYVEVMVRGIFMQRPVLRDVVVAAVGCVLPTVCVFCCPVRSMYSLTVVSTATSFLVSLNVRRMSRKRLYIEWDTWWNDLLFNHSLIFELQGSWKIGSTLQKEEKWKVGVSLFCLSSSLMRTSPPGLVTYFRVLKTAFWCCRAPCSHRPRTDRFVTIHIVLRFTGLWLK
jgi:hypothetical protein